MHAHVYLSNRIEVLIEALKGELVTEGDLFSERLVIPATRALKNELMCSLAADENLQVAAGFDTLFMHGAFGYLRTRCYSDEMAVIPSTFELTMRLLASGSHVPLQREQLSTAYTLAQSFLQALHVGRSLPDPRFEALFGADFMQRLFKPQRISVHEPIACHLFGFSSIPPPYFTFFHNLSQQIPVRFYLLSPCSEFWSDQLSPHELEKLMVSSAYSHPVRVQIEESYATHNPLLATCGRLGRTLARLLEESALSVDEHYHDPSRECLLSHLQSDLLYNQKNEYADQQSAEDQSLALLHFSTPYREIEGIYHLIKQSIHLEGMKPSEVIVMAPDIAPYESAIAAIFGRDIDYQIADLPLVSTHELWMGLGLLFALDEKRYSPIALIELISLPLFAACSGWDQEAVDKIRHFIQLGRVRFGIDAEDLGACFDATGTWEAAFDRLLDKVDRDKADRDHGIPMSDGILLEGWISRLRALFVDLTWTRDSASRAPHEWIEYIKMLSQRYFGCAFNDEILQPLEVLCSGSQRDKEIPCTFTCFRFFYERIVQQERRALREDHIEAVRFGSIRALRGISASMVLLIGMNERALSPLCDELKESRADVERYGLIEAVLSARRRLVITYIARDLHTGNIRLPVSSVASLMRYMPLRKIEHPHFSCDPSYFAEGRDFFLANTSVQDYKEALGESLQSAQESIHPPKPNFSPCLGIEHREEPCKLIDLAEIEQALRSPLRLYFKENYGLHFKRSWHAELMMTEQSEFALHPIDAAVLRGAWCEERYKEVLKRYEREGRLPIGHFKPSALARLERERTAIAERFASLSEGSERSITLSPNDNHERDTFYRTPLMIDGGKRGIIGRLDGIVKQGLFVRDRFTRERAIVHLPAFVLADLIAIEGPCQSLIFGRDGKSKPRFAAMGAELMGRLIDFRERAKAEPLCILPSFVPAMLRGDCEALRAAIHEALERGYDEAFCYAARSAIPDADEIMATHGLYVKTLFGEMGDAWF